MADPFWINLDRFIAAHPVVIDRARGSAHPRYADLIYPLDYGYLADTRAGDGSGIDVWVGSLPMRQVTAVMLTVDLEKHDLEYKVLLGCTPAEAETVKAWHNSGEQTGILIKRFGEI